MKDRIRLIRKEAGLTQTRFGERLGGMTLSTVQKWELGHNQPDAASIRLICDTFGISERWLLTGEGEMRAPVSREQEMARLVRSLMEDSSESFRSALVTTLLRFDPAGPEWEILERIYEGIAREWKNGQ